MAIESAFDRVRATDPTVHGMLKCGRTLADLIVALVCEKNRLLQYIMALESIAPRKIELPDGTVMIWRCPDELVPDRPLLAAKFVTCPGCGNVIEPAICWCGDYIPQHGDRGHSPVPMGCDCGRVKTEQQPVRPTWVCPACMSALIAIRGPFPDGSITGHCNYCWKRVVGRLLHSETPSLNKEQSVKS